MGIYSYFMIKTDENLIKSYIVKPNILKIDNNFFDLSLMKKIPNKNVLDSYCFEKAKKTLALQKQIAIRLKKVISLKTSIVDISKSQASKNHLENIDFLFDDSNKLNNALYSVSPSVFENKSKINTNIKKPLTRLTSIKPETDYRKINIDPKYDKHYIEWWDKNILNNSIDNEKKIKIRKENITIYIEHPPLQISYSEQMEMLPLKMTKKEIKKIRTQRRLRREKEKQELIRQGFLEPSKPRVKISNIIKTSVFESVQNPTQMENKIQEHSKTIKKAHSDRNLASKLSPLEVKEKKDSTKAITNTDIHVVIYRVTPLEHSHNKYKIRINALENQLTGLCLTSSKMTIII